MNSCGGDFYRQLELIRSLKLISGLLQKFHCLSINGRKCLAATRLDNGAIATFMSEWVEPNIEITSGFAAGTITPTKAWKSTKVTTTVHEFCVWSSDGQGSTEGLVTLAPLTLASSLGVLWIEKSKSSPSTIFQVLTAWTASIGIAVALTTKFVLDASETHLVGMAGAISLV